MQQFTVPLSRLLPSKQNPRRVKPAREAHQRLVALIKAHGLIHPLVVRPCEGKRNRFQVVAGDRRLAALREIHKHDGDPRIPCVLRKLDQAAADALSLGENFGREPMHPLDEAEAFAKLTTQKGKDAKAVGAEFGVSEHYVKQRLSLSSLAAPIKQAYREYKIDTATAEAFSAVPAVKQLEVWKEVDAHPRHADHVRNIIANDWIDSKLALFDIAKLPPSAVTQDLFSEKILIERQAFMDAQTQAVVAQQTAMKESGWSEVIIGRRDDVRDKLMSMDTAARVFEKEALAELKKLERDRKALLKQAQKLDPEDERARDAVGEKIESIEEHQRQIAAGAPETYSEKTKAVGTAFIMLDPDGQVHREYRIPRRRDAQHDEHDQHRHRAGEDGASNEPEAPTSYELSDRQLAVTFTHQAIAVREALLKDPLTRKRILVLMLHDKVRSEALSIRHDANGTTVHASTSEEFKSPAFDRLTSLRDKLDPFVKQHHVEDTEGYVQLGKLTGAKLDSLIDLLIVECITSHMQRRTELVQLLADELKVDVRADWRPDASWLGSYQKLQLAHLITSLQGPVHAPSPDRKKSELVEQLDKFFTAASQGKLEDQELAEKANQWLPSNLRDPNS